ncbi:uncharacterized protein LOC135843646 [Planococcus citri]|uniref:uncharacterized protein LOC135843646 n=1 Tax=Planococcus citri TaxID=170843 RepID=UPI0031FA2689
MNSYIKKDTIRILLITTLLSFEIQNASTSSSPICSDTTINTDDFRALRLHRDLYVDKTFLLDDFVKLEGSRMLTTIIRPKGWGKSINLDMIRRFFEIEVDEKGERVFKDRSINNKLFSGGEVVINSTSRKTLKKLKVNLFAARHLGQFPVILLKLKNTSGNSYQEIESKVKARVQDVFKDHEYLLNSTRITLKEKFESYIKGDFDTADLISSVLFLSTKLQEHFGRKVYILMDDYDAPFVNAYVGFGNKAEEFDKLQSLIIDFYTKTFQGNPSLSATLVTGVLHISLMPTMNTGLNNIDLCTLTRSQFSKSFGITEPEVQELLKQVSSTIKLDPKEVKDWYNGYNFNIQTYYNAWSIMRCLHQNGTLGYHGFDTDSNGLVDKILLSDEIQETVHLLLSGKSLNFPKLHSRTEVMSWDKMDELEVLLLYGYLSAEGDSFDTASKITIPNKEIKHVFETKVLQWVAGKFGVNASEFRSFANLLPAGEFETFKDTLQKYLSKCSSNLLSRVLYDGVITALKNALTTSHKAQDGKKDDAGESSDLVVLIPDPGLSDAVIVIKHKIAKMEDLVSVAKTGLEEINAGLSSNNLKTLSHVKKIFKISIAFNGEKVTVEYKTD